MELRFSKWLTGRYGLMKRCALSEFPGTYITLESKFLIYIYIDFDQYNNYNYTQNTKVYRSITASFTLRSPGPT